METDCHRLALLTEWLRALVRPSPALRSSWTAAKLYPRKEITISFIAWERRFECEWDNLHTKKVIYSLSLVANFIWCGFHTFPCAAYARISCCIIMLMYLHVPLLLSILLPNCIHNPPPDVRSYRGRLLLFASLTLIMLVFPWFIVRPSCYDFTQVCLMYHATDFMCRTRGQGCQRNPDHRTVLSG